jgi:hypothetical protein
LSRTSRSHCRASKAVARDTPHLTGGRFPLLRVVLLGRDRRGRLIGE